MTNSMYLLFYKDEIRLIVKASEYVFKSGFKMSNVYQIIVHYIINK